MTDAATRPATKVLSFSGSIASADPSGKRPANTSNPPILLFHGTCGYFEDHVLRVLRRSCPFQRNPLQSRTRVSFLGVASLQRGWFGKNEHAIARREKVKAHQAR